MSVCRYVRMYACMYTLQYPKPETLSLNAKAPRASELSDMGLTSELLCTLR